MADTDFRSPDAIRRNRSIIASYAGVWLESEDHTGFLHFAARVCERLAQHEEWLMKLEDCINTKVTAANEINDDIDKRLLRIEKQLRTPMPKREAP